MHRTHHATDATEVACFVLVVSDSRTLDTDEAGKLIADKLVQAGHRVLERAVVPDDREVIGTRMREVAGRADVEVVVVTGGTGLALRDVTPEAIGPLLTRELPGFGEAFRRMSYDEVGVVGLLSRAFAGVVDRTLVFALPGSRKACATAVERLIVPMLPHAVALLRSPGS